ncbi:hypothetical protein TNCV_916341 [Trichonephila clavipes]|nr:hypothetical protein TNCV_916341 [Trichonephila clavipes]
MFIHSVAHDRRSSHYRRRKHLWFPVKGKRSNRRIAYNPNGIEWYEMTPILSLDKISPSVGHIANSVPN